ELVKSPLPAAEHERHEHTAQRPEPVLAKVLAIGEQEELPFAVQCPPGLIVHEDLAIAAEFEVSQSVARHLPLAPFRNVGGQIPVHVNQAATDNGIVLPGMPIKERADVPVGKISKPTVVLHRLSVRTSAILGVEDRKSTRLNSSHVKTSYA